MKHRLNVRGKDHFHTVSREVHILRIDINLIMEDIYCSLKTCYWMEVILVTVQISTSEYRFGLQKGFKNQKILPNLESVMIQMDFRSHVPLFETGFICSGPKGAEEI